MTIKVACKCGKLFAAQPHLAGKRIKCPSCGLAMTVPEQQTSPEIATTSKHETQEDSQAKNPAQYPYMISSQSNRSIDIIDFFEIKWSK